MLAISSLVIANFFLVLNFHVFILFLLSIFQEGHEYRCHSQPLQRSLLPLSVTIERQALAIHKIIMRYVRDRSLSGQLVVIANYITQKVSVGFSLFQFFDSIFELQLASSHLVQNVLMVLNWYVYSQTQASSATCSFLQGKLFIEWLLHIVFDLQLGGGARERIFEVYKQ